MTQEITTCFIIVKILQKQLGEPPGERLPSVCHNTGMDFPSVFSVFCVMKNKCPTQLVLRHQSVSLLRLGIKFSSFFPCFYQTLLDLNGNSYELKFQIHAQCELRGSGCLCSPFSRKEKPDAGFKMGYCAADPKHADFLPLDFHYCGISFVLKVQCGVKC